MKQYLENGAVCHSNGQLLPSGGRKREPAKRVIKIFSHSFKSLLLWYGMCVWGGEGVRGGFHQPTQIAHLVSRPLRPQDSLFGLVEEGVMKSQPVQMEQPL